MRKHIFAALSLVGAVCIANGQGSLTPPGTPGATMKTLDQIDAAVADVSNRVKVIDAKVDLVDVKIDGVEARIDLATVAGSSSYHHTITQPGSYYLSGNLEVTKTSGIYIGVSGVTLDLNGYNIVRADGSGSGGYGIYLNSGTTRVTIRNGSIAGFQSGIYSYSIHGLYEGLVAEGCSSYGFYFINSSRVLNCAARSNKNGIYTSHSSVLENCVSSGNSGGLYGIYAGGYSSLAGCVSSYDSVANAISAGTGSTLTRCTVNNNSGGTGIYAGDASSVIECSAYNNTGDFGIRARSGCTIRNCEAWSNDGTGASSSGIFTGYGCRISDCSVMYQSHTNSTTITTQGVGIRAEAGSSISGCNVQYNRGNGIMVTSACLVKNNQCTGNGFSTGTGAGIFIDDSDNRIEGNNVVSNDRGIETDSYGNFFARNTASGNSTNWEIAAFNACLVVQAYYATGAISGDTGGASPGSTDPNANFTY